MRFKYWIYLIIIGDKMGAGSEGRINKMAEGQMRMSRGEMNIGDSVGKPFVIGGGDEGNKLPIYSIGAGTEGKKYKGSNFT